MKRRRGSAMIETALYIPILVLLLFGMVELARVSYTYYTLQKILYTLARDVSTRQDIDFCGAELSFDAAKNFALRGGVEQGAEAIVPNLTADQIAVAFERRDAISGDLGSYTAECGATSAGPLPDYVVVSIPDGYPIRLTFPGLLLDPIPLRVRIRLPFGGAS